MSDIYLRLAHSVRRERTRLGWTQEELGEKAGLHPSYIGQIERSRKKVSLATVERLAQAFKTTVGDLLAEKAPPAKGSGWEARIDGLLQDRTLSEKTLIYNTLKELARNIRKTH